MLELKSYTKPEMTAMLESRDIQALKRKLNRYNVEYEVQGRGENAIFTIKKINKPFKLYCIMNLGVGANTDFRKLRNFYYYYFNDEEFRAMPDEVKEGRMRDVHKDVSRQAIASYTKKLEENNLIYKDTKNFIYYFAYMGEQRIVEKSEYSQAWREYWRDIEETSDYWFAITNMICNYGGVARKQPVVEINGFYNKEIEYLLNLVIQDMVSDL